MTNKPASAANGTNSTTEMKRTEKTRIHTPCRIADARDFAPALTLLALRTITPVTGSPPAAPETMLAAPCPSSSRSKLVRGPVCILSMATADSRLSTLAINAIVSTPVAIPAHCPSGSAGRLSASIRLPGSSIRSTSRSIRTEIAVATTTATRAAGTFVAIPGIRGHASIRAITMPPMRIDGHWPSAIDVGMARRFSTAELSDSPPRRT